MLKHRIERWRDIDPHEADLARRRRGRAASAYIKFVLLVGVIALSALTANARDDNGEAGRDWSNEDSVAVRHYSAVPTYVRTDEFGQPIVPSPDGRYFYVLSNWGDLQCDCSIQALEVYDSAAVKRWLHSRRKSDSRPIPTTRIEMQTRAETGLAITFISWVVMDYPRSSIVFIGTDKADHLQVYRLTLPSGALEALTNDPYEKFYAYARKNAVIFRENLPVSKDTDPQYPMIPAPRNESGDIVIPPAAYPFRSQWMVAAQGANWSLPTGNAPFADVWFAPDGTKAVVVPEGDPTVRAFLLVDFKAKASKSLALVGNGRENGLPTALWSKDGKTVVLAGVSLPPAVSGESPDARNGSWIASYNVQSGSWLPVVAISGDDNNQGGRTELQMKWVNSQADLMVTHDTTDRRRVQTTYTHVREGWLRRSSSTEISPPKSPIERKFAGGLKVAVRQSANDPPEVVASDGKLEGTLSNSDPALTGIWRARLEPYKWEVAGQGTVTGGLAIPRGRTSRQPLPLVVQAYFYDPDKFLPDGPTPTAYAMQTLVAHGIAVLAMNIQDMPGYHTPDEGHQFEERMTAAIESLVRDGVVDPARVGAVGFSRAGYEVLYALTHMKSVHIAAAECADSVTFSFPEYLALGTNGVGPRGPERVQGGSFWKDRTDWLEKDVLFNVDRIDAPILFTANHMSGQFDTDIQFSELATIGAMQLNHRPFDYLFFPRGIHTLALPRERVASMDATVDWMVFWLQGRENQGPRKASQYARWRLIQKKWLEESDAHLKSKE